MEQIFDIAVIGGGPGGYTAALYGARAGQSVVVLEKLVAGGQMAETVRIDNYPGFEKGIDGFTLGEKMRMGAESFGVKTIFAEVRSLDLSGKMKILSTADDVIRARTLIYAAGAAPKRLNLPQESTFAGRGVHYCVSCDGAFYRGKKLVVVGGGNSAAAGAIGLSKLAEKVILVHRRDHLRASQGYRKSIMDTANIEICWNSTITELLGKESLCGVRLKNTCSMEERELYCDGVFVCIGRKPETDLLAGWITLDSDGYVPCDEGCQTTIAGVYAVGDVRTKPLRQIITAAADGAVAAHMAAQYLQRDVDEGGTFDTL